MLISDPEGRPRGRTTTRVRYPETDRMGWAHHASYVVWFELGRTELLRDLGCPYGEIEDREGIRFPVAELAASYRRPAVYDEELRITTRLASARGARIRFEYTVERESSGAPLATGFTVHAAVGRDRRPRRIPDWLARKLEGVAPGGRP